MKIRIQFEDAPDQIKRVSDNIHNIVTESVKAGGKLTKIQQTAVATALTNALHEKIDFISENNRLQHKLNASGWLRTKRGSHFYLSGKQSANGGFEYEYGLLMKHYGWIMGSDSLNLTSSAIPALAEWLAIKSRRWGMLVTYSKYSKEQKKRVPEKAVKKADYISAARAIVAHWNDKHNDHTVPRWYKDATDTSGATGYMMRSMMLKTRGLIPALKKSVIKEINKRGK